MAGHFTSIVLTWDLIDDITETEIWVSETDDINTARLVERVTGCYYSHEVGATQVRYYWLRNKRGVNVGSFDQLQGRKGESGVDIDAELEVLNKELGKNIIEEIIDTALPARKLGMMKYVSNPDLSQYQGQNLIYDEVANKQYMWNGTAYVPMEQEILASAIKGIIQPSQLAPIPTTNLAGAITAEKMSANSVGANAIQANAVTSDKISANAVTAGNIQAGAINANHLQAGQISADKLAIGLGGNLLYNPIFANNGNGWIYYVDINNIENNGFGFNNTTGTYQSGAYLPTENQFRLRRLRKSITGDVRLGGLYQDMKLTPNTYYCFSAYVGGHRSYVDLSISEGGVQIIHKSWSGRGRTGGYPNNTIDTGIENSYRIWLLFKTNATNSAETNYRVIINTWGQNGQDDPMFIIRRPMLEECTEYTKEPSPWQNSGVTAIHGGSIVTNTITAQQIAAGTITANEIATGAIAAKHIASNTISASHIVSKSLTSDKLGVSTLSAISADMGAITAGSLNIASKFIVSSSGDVEIRGASGNVGMIIRNDRIDVYDASGNLKVRLGKLT